MRSFIAQIRNRKFHSFPCAFSFFFSPSWCTRVFSFQPPPSPHMSKRTNDDGLKHGQSANAKRSRKSTGFRPARPQQAGPESSSSTSSRITTLVLGPNGRLGGKRKDKTRSQLVSKYPLDSTPSMPTQFYTTAPHIQAETPAEKVIPSATDIPEFLYEGTFQPEAASIEVTTGTEPKAKRKRNNDSRVCDSALTTSLTEHISFWSPNFKSGSRFEILLLTRSYAMTDWETISDSHSVLHAISSLGFSNAKIAWVGLDYDARIVLLSCTKKLRCTE